MRTNLILLSLITSLILGLGVTSAGCDRLTIISGTVYEWVDAPPNAVSKIYHKEISSSGLLKEDLPEGIILNPLGSAHVQCFGEFQQDTFYSNEVSDAEGRFRVVISLGQRTEDYTTTVDITRRGFLTVRRDITDRGDSHSLTVLMVRQPEPGEE